MGRWPSVPRMDRITTARIARLASGICHQLSGASGAAGQNRRSAPQPISATRARPPTSAAL